MKSQSLAKSTNLRSLFNFFYSKRLLFVELDNSKEVQHPDNNVGWVDLMPTNASKIRPRSILVVVVVIALAHHQEVERQEVLRSVSHLEIPVAILVGKPVDNGPMDRAHEEVYWQ